MALPKSYSENLQLPAYEESTGENIVIYHGKCTDGFGAAYAAWKVLGDNAQYVPIRYGRDDKSLLEQIPSVEGKNVYILDFSFSPADHEEIVNKAARVQLIDHHETAYKSLCNCKGCFFDLEHSGAMLAWRYFKPEMEPPDFIKLIQDKDLWQFNYEDTKGFIRALKMLKEDFQVWQQMENPDFLANMIAHGKDLEVIHQRQLNELMKTAKPVVIDGVSGWAINAPAMFASDLGEMLAKKSGTFGLVWQDNGENIQCELRSQDNFNCSEIAVKFGGGGHAQASAFRAGGLEDFMKKVQFAPGVADIAVASQRMIEIRKSFGEPDMVATPVNHVKRAL